MLMPQSCMGWSPRAQALPLVMCWLSGREKGLQPSWPWGTSRECAEHEGPYWPTPQVHLASYPFQAMTKGRCPWVNARTRQVILLSFFPPSTLPTSQNLQFGNFLVRKWFLHIWTLTAFLFCDFPLEAVWIFGVHNFLCQGMVVCARHPHLAIFPLFWLLLSPHNTLGLSSRM